MDKLTGISEPIVILPMGMDCRAPKHPDQWSYADIHRMKTNNKLGEILLSKVPEVYGLNRINEPKGEQE